MPGRTELWDCPECGCYYVYSVHFTFDEYWYGTNGTETLDRIAREHSDVMHAMISCRVDPAAIGDAFFALPASVFEITLHAAYEKDRAFVARFIPRLVHAFATRAHSVYALSLASSRRQLKLVAVQPTPRGFSGLKPEGTANEADCQEDDVYGSHSSSALEHPRRSRSRGGRQPALTRAHAPRAREPARVRDQCRDRAVEQMLIGVTTRRYARSLEPLPADLPSRGTSRSAVSRRFVAATERQMTEWLGRDLSALDLGVLMIDGVYIDDRVLLVALGIDADGKKHVLGVREGATENGASCTALLSDLGDRGLRTDRPILVVIDGAKALAKAARSVFGERAITGAGEGMTALMRALARHESSTTAVTSRTRVAS